LITTFTLFILTTLLYFGVAYISLKASEGAQINGVQSLQKNNYEKSSGKQTRDQLIAECNKKETEYLATLKTYQDTLNSLISSNNNANTKNSEGDEAINKRIEADKKIITDANNERTQALRDDPKLKDNGTKLSGIQKKIDDANKRIDKDKLLLGKGTAVLSDTGKTEEEIRKIREDITKNSNYKQDLLSGKIEITTEGTKADIKTAQEVQFKTEDERKKFYFFLALMLECGMLWSGILRQLRKNKNNKEPIFNKINQEKEIENKQNSNKEEKGEQKEMIDLGKLFKKEAKKEEIITPVVEEKKNYQIPYSSLREEIINPKLEIKQEENKEEKQEFKNNDLDELEKKAIEFSENGKLLSHVRLAEKLNISRTQVIKLYYKMEQTGKAETRFIGDKPIGTWLI
jgi:hypothetical protein